MRKARYILQIILLTILLQGVWLNEVWGQLTVDNYSFSTSTGASFLAPSWTKIINAGIDGGTSGAQNIGFNFIYEGTTYTQFVATSDGFIKLGNTATVQYSNNITSTTNQPKLMPFWDDLSTASNGGVWVGISGTAPNQICVIGFRLYYSYGTGSSWNISYQILLHEGTNVIEYIYDANMGTMSGSCGIGGATAANYISVNTSTHVSSNSTAKNDNSNTPTSGRKYTFTPPSTCTEPTTEPSGISFSNVGCSTTDVSWTGNGDGDMVLVVAKESGATLTNPSSGTSYTANSTFSSGTEIGTGNYVVYDGDGTSPTVAVTGLSGGTTYDYAIYAYNTTDDCYYLTAYETGSQATSGSVVTQASAFISNTKVRYCQMDLSWTRGTGDGLLIIARQGSAVATDPTDGVTYTADAEYTTGNSIGSGYVIYNSTGTSMTFTGLTASTTYHFALYEYSTTCGSPIYKLAGYVPASQTTTAAVNPATQASVGSFSNTTCTGMDVSWTRGSGDHLLIIARTGAVTDPTHGVSYTADSDYSGSGSAIGATGKVVYNGDGTSVSVSGLSPGTLYYFDFYEYYDCYRYRLAQYTVSNSTLGTTPASLTSISAGNATCSSLDITNIVGLSEKVLIIARQGGSATDPTNGNTYSASSVFGSGDPIGTGFVVYAGAMPALPYTVTNLSGGTSYSFDAYHYSDACTTPLYNMTQDVATTSTSGAAATVSAVTSSTPNGTYIIGEVITITVTFTQTVTVTGSPLLLLETGAADQNATYSSGSGTNTLTFLYTVQSGDVSADLNCQSTGALTLNGGTINDPCSPAILTVGATMLSSTKAIVIDGNPPVVTTYNPADNSVNAGYSQDLTLTFDQNIQVGTAGTFVIYNSGGSTFESFAYNASEISFSGNTVTINPSSDFTPGNSYYVQISATAVRDLNGNYYAGIADNSTWNFTIYVPQNFYINDNSLTGDVYCSAIGDDANTGGTGDPFASLDIAISAASDGDIIYIDAGTYHTSAIPFATEWRNITLAKELTFIGAGADLTIIDDELDGAATNYFMYVTADNVTFRDMTIQGYENNGTQTPGHSGQALTIGNGATGVLIEDVIMSNNGASGGNPSITVLANCSVTIRGGGGLCNTWHTAYTGGVEAFGNGITLNIEDYVLAYNFKTNAYDGGGLLISNTNATTTVNVTNCYFYNNEASDGGGISQRGGVLNVTDCIIDGNLAGQTSTPIYGGGIRMTGGTATYTRVRFENNAVGSSGGTLRGAGVGLYSIDDAINLTLDNCYFAGNVGAEGDDIYADKYMSNNLNVTVTHTTFSGSADAIFNKDATIQLTNCSNPTVAGSNSPAVNKINTLAPSSVPDPSTPGIASGDCSTGITLPVELSVFSGKLVKDVVLLNWTTASEINNDYFIIEKSSDLIDFNKIGTINGQGNSNSLTDYSFTDENPIYGNNYYRLKQVDYDGSSAYSSIVVVYITEISSDFMNSYFNQKTNSLNVSLKTHKSASYNINIFDALGRLILTKQIDAEDGINDYEIQMPENIFGAVIVTVLNDHELYNNKVLIIRN